MQLRHHLLSAPLLIISCSVAAASGGVADEQQGSIEPFLKREQAKHLLSPIPLPTAPGWPKPSRTERHYIGLEAGITTSMQFGGRNYAVAGNYADGLRNAELRQYSPGVTYVGHAVLDVALTKDVGAQTKIGYRMHKANAKGISAAGNISGKDPQFENSVNFTWDYLAIDALFRVQLMKNAVYALAGIGYSSLQHNFVSGIQTFTQQDGTTSQMAFEGELNDFYNVSRIDAKIGLGTWLPLGDGGAMIAPEVMVGIPLTPLHTKKTSDAYQEIDREVNNMAYASLGFAIKFPFGGHTTDDNAPIASYSAGTSNVSNETLDEDAIMLRGRVIDHTGLPIDNAQVTVVDLSNNHVIATAETDNGSYNMKLPGAGRYSITADAPSYLFGTMLFEVGKDGRMPSSIDDITLAASTEGRIRLLIFFDFDKATLQSASYPELNRAVVLMKTNPAMQVEIAGFTDAQGTESYNKDLSQRRATAVRDYLVQLGIAPDRLTAIGYGEENPVASNDTEDGRAENRRVEFVVVKR